MISVRFQVKPFNITVIQVYIPITNAEEAEVEGVYEDLQELLVKVCNTFGALLGGQFVLIEPLSRKLLRT